MAEMVATNVVASQTPNGDRLQRRPLVPKIKKLLNNNPLTSSQVDRLLSTDSAWVLLPTPTHQNNNHHHHCAAMSLTTLPTHHDTSVIIAQTFLQLVQFQKHNCFGLAWLCFKLFDQPILDCCIQEIKSFYMRYLPFCLLYTRRFSIP